MFIVDAIMDMTFSVLYVDHFTTNYPENPAVFIKEPGVFLTAITDLSVDILQTYAINYSSIPTKQQKNTPTISSQITTIPVNCFPLYI